MQVHVKLHSRARCYCSTFIRGSLVRCSCMRSLRRAVNYISSWSAHLKLVTCGSVPGTNREVVGNFLRLDAGGGMQAVESSSITSLPGGACLNQRRATHAGQHYAELLPRTTHMVVARPKAVWPNRHAASSIKSSLVSRRPCGSTRGQLEWCSGAVRFSLHQVGFGVTRPHYVSGPTRSGGEVHAMNIVHRDLKSRTRSDPVGVHG